MKKQVTLNLPDHFAQICEFMEISPRIFLERLVDNILSYEEIQEPDSIETILAVRYFLAYSENRNKVYDYHAKVKGAFINESLRHVDGFLKDLKNYSEGKTDKSFQGFLIDWRTKWSGIIELFNEDVSEAPTEQVSNTPPIWREIAPFESIGLDTFADIVLTKGEQEKILIVSDQDIDQAIRTEVEDSRLWISTTRSDSPRVLPETTIIISYVTLNGLWVNDSGIIRCNQPIEISKLGIVQNGKGNIFLDVDVLSLDITLTKTGNVSITGSTDEIKVLNHRSGKFDGSKLETSSAKVTIRGSGSVSIQVEDELIAILQGTGDLMYKGTPRLKSLSNNGTGRLKQI